MRSTARDCMFSLLWVAVFIYSANYAENGFRELIYEYLAICDDNKLQTFMEENMKKFITLMLVVVMLLAVFTGCGKKEDESVIVIGGSGPLTGDYATYGTSVKNGAALAVEEINAKGGVGGMQLVLEFEDDEAGTEQAVSAYNTLMDKGMDVSLGATTSGSCIAVTEEVKKDGLLMLTPSGSQLECTQYDNCFRVCFQDPEQGLYSAKFIKENMTDITKVAVLYDKSNDYSVGIHDSFIAKAAEIGLEVATDQAFTDQSNTDFSVQLQAIKDSGAELLFLPLYAQECAYILTQANDIDLDVIFFGVDGMDGILQKIGEDNLALTEGVMLLTPFAADSLEEPTKSFTAAYKEAYNTVPDQFAADAYDAVYIIKAAMEHAQAFDPTEDDFNEKLIAAMLEIEVKGTTGTMTWTAEGEPAKEATANVIKDGAYVAFS